MRKAQTKSAKIVAPAGRFYKNQNVQAKEVVGSLLHSQERASSPYSRVGLNRLLPLFVLCALCE
jgi:hypothetical protein